MLLWFGLWAHSGDPLVRLNLLLGVEGSLALVVPELPSALALVAVGGEELHGLGLLGGQVLLVLVLADGCLLRVLSCYYRRSSG